MDHADGDGTDGGARESAGDVGDAGAAGFDVDGEGEEGVDEGRGRRHPGASAATRAILGDTGDVGGELDQ